MVNKTPIQQLELRVKRVAKHIPLGDAIYEFLQQHVSELMVVADVGDPPISAVSQKLIDRFGAIGVDIKHQSVKSFIGMAVKLIMLKHDYVSDERGIRIPHDPVFTSGMTYKKVVPEPLASKLSFASVNEEGETLAFRMLMAAIPVMTVQEKQAFLIALRKVDELKKAS